MMHAYLTFVNSTYYWTIRRNMRFTAPTIVNQPSHDKGYLDIRHQQRYLLHWV